MGYFSADAALESSPAWLDRAISSWHGAEEALKSRVASGVQPTFPLTGMRWILAMNALYVIITFCLYVYMKNFRKNGFQIRKLISVYNAICVLLAGYVVVGIAKYKWQTRKTAKFVCNDEDLSDQGHQLGFVFWVFYAQKFWEFMDTWFFILRKSFRQVTFLHLFHHSSITIVVGTILPRAFSGDMYLPIILNAFVHVLMYSHYLVTALGIRSWWRPYLTSLQLIQFILISTQSIMAWNAGPLCGVPDYGKLILVAYMFSMLYLFSQFFVRRYLVGSSSASMSGVIKSVDAGSTTYRGSATFDGKGEARLVMPNHFKLRGKDETVSQSFVFQLTPIGAAMPSLHATSDKLFTDDRIHWFSCGGGVAGKKVSWTVVSVLTPKPSEVCKSRRGGGRSNGKKNQ